jgi:hypothetical protein
VQKIDVSEFLRCFLEALDKIGNPPDCAPPHERQRNKKSSPVSVENPVKQTGNVFDKSTVVESREPHNVA